MSLIGLIFGLVVGCQRNDFSGAGEIRIGAVASLTGPAAEQGKSWLNGARLAVQDLHARGIEVKLFVEDDQTSPAKAASAFHKLIDIDRAQAAIGGTWDYLAEALYPLAERYRIPFITPTNPVELFSEAAKKNPYVYSNALTLKAEKEAAKPLLSNLKIRKAALLYPDLPWGTEHARMFRELADELKLEIVYNDAFPFEGYLTAVKTAALKIVESKADLVYAPISYEGINLTVTELERLKAKPYLLVSQHLHTALERIPDKSLLSRAYGVYPEQGGDAFAEHYNSVIGESPEVYASAGYDACMFLALAAHANIDVREPSAKFSYAGVTGLHAINPNSRSLVDNHAVILTVYKGRLNLWTQPPADAEP